MTKQVRHISTQKVYWEGMTLGSVREEIDTIIKEHGDLCQFDTDEDPYDDYSYPVIRLYRMETDMEEQEREYAEKEYQKNAREERQKLYEKLKKEFNA
jgi:pyruvate/2-oxoacid:ferredoxin oxidoreductase alpha subunit